MSDLVVDAEKLSNQRARMIPFFGVGLLAAQQWLFFNRSWDQLSLWQLGLWSVIAVLALLFLVTGGAWFRSREVRALINDEVSQRNRQRGIMAGFVASIFTAMLVFAVSPFEPLPAQRAAHIICSFGLGIGLLVFGIAEMSTSDE